MEFPQGNLVSLREQPRDAAFVRHVLRGALAALAAYHDKGRAYGQVRPDTIYLAGDGRVRLGDVRATIVSTQVGPPEGMSKYLPPEALATGSGGEVGPASDIYALGLVALELLTGPRFESLFPGVSDDVLGGDLAWMRWHGSIDQRLPSVAALVPGMDATLAATLDRMLTKPLDARFATAAQAIAALDAQPGDSPAAASPVAPIAAMPATASAPAVEAAPVVAAPLDAPLVTKTATLSSTATVKAFDDADLPPIAPVAPPAVAKTLVEPARSVEPRSPERPADRQSQAAVRGTMMPNMDEDLAAQPGPMPVQLAATQFFEGDAPATPAAVAPPNREPAKEPPAPAKQPAGVDARRVEATSESLLASFPKPRRRLLDQPAVVLLMCVAVIAAVAYVLFGLWSIDDGMRAVAISSEPPGATVEIDGLKQEKLTPLTVRLPIGSHAVRMSQAGYHDLDHALKIAADDAPDSNGRRLALTMHRIQTHRDVYVESNPPGATIYLDGSATPFERKAPTEIPMRLGRHTIRLTLLGHQDQSTEVDVVQGGTVLTQRIPLVALPKPKRELVLVVDPLDAQITAGGKPVAVTAGRGSVFLDEGGTTEVEVSAPGFVPWKRGFTYNDIGMTTTSTVYLDPYLTFNPKEVDVVIDDHIASLIDGRAVLRRGTTQQYHIVAKGAGRKTLDRKFTWAELVAGRFQVELPSGPKAPAILRRLDDGRYAHVALGQAGAPLSFVAFEEPGTFDFGVSGNDLRDGELAARKVKFNRPFLVSATEISVQQYELFAQAKGGVKAGDKWRPSDPAAAAKLPVTNVTLSQAKACAEWLGGRLPTEEQWERAARGANGRMFPWKGDERPTEGRCNLDKPKGSLLAVESLAEGKTPEGLFHTLGNAAEWCDTPYHAGFRDIDNNISGIDEFYVIRGGSYVDAMTDARLTMRANHDPAVGGHDIGFRVVIDFEDE